MLYTLKTGATCTTVAVSGFYMAMKSQPDGILAFLQTVLLGSTALAGLCAEGSVQGKDCCLVVLPPSGTSQSLARSSGFQTSVVLFCFI